MIRAALCLATFAIVAACSDDGDDDGAADGGGATGGSAGSTGGAGGATRGTGGATGGAGGVGGGSATADGGQPIGAICATNANCDQSQGKAVCGDKVCCEIVAGGQTNRACVPPKDCTGKLIP